MSVIASLASFVAGAKASALPAAERDRQRLHLTDTVVAALAGAHIATMPFKVLDMLFNHPLTDKGLEQFLKDYNKVFQETPAAR